MGRRLPSIALLVVLSLVAAGCARKNSNVTEAQTEGLYMNVGPLLYQVQISRFLNPADPEDRAYLIGLPTGTSPQTGNGQTWFGVFMRVQNVTDQTHIATARYSIRDTQGHVIRPVPLDSRLNPFAYVAEPVGPNSISPGLETPAFNGPIQGSLILFKLPTSVLPNRPLQLVIQGTGGARATIDLDL